MDRTIIEFDYIPNYSIEEKHYQVYVYDFDRYNIHGIAINYLDDNEKHNILSLSTETVRDLALSARREANHYSKDRWFKTEKIKNIREFVISI